MTDTSIKSICRQCGSDNYEYLVQTVPCCNQTACSDCIVQFLLTSTIPMCRICQNVWYSNDLVILLSYEDYKRVAEYKHSAALTMDMFYKQLYDTTMEVCDETILNDIVHKYSLTDLPSNRYALMKYLYKVAEENDIEEIRDTADILNDLLYEFSNEMRQSFMNCSNSKPDERSLRDCLDGIQYLNIINRVLDDELNVQYERCGHCDYILPVYPQWNYVNCRSCTGIMRLRDRS